MYACKTIILSLLSALSVLSPSTNAQLVSGVSSSCSSALAGFLLGDLGSCLSLTTLLPVLSSSTSSVITSLDSYLSTICSNAPCSNTTITNALTTLDSSCQADIANGTEIVVLLNAVVQNYNVEYEVACLESTSNSSRCLTSTLTNVQSSLGQTVTLDYLAELLAGTNSTQLTALESLGPSVYCTDCVKAIYDVIVANNATAADSQIARAVTTECGANFTNGTYPTGVTNPLTSSTASSAIGSATASTTTAAASSGKRVEALMGGKGNVIAGFVGLVGTILGAGAVLA